MYNGDPQSLVHFWSITGPGKVDYCLQCYSIRIIIMNDFSVRLSKLAVVCCTGDMVISHIMYVDGRVLLAPSAKGMQRLIDAAYKYGCQYDIIFNSSKSQMMLFDTRTIDHTVDYSIGSSIMNETTSYTYLGHIITNNLSDDADIEDNLEVSMSGLTRYFLFFYFAQIRLRISNCIYIAATSIVLCW